MIYCGSYETETIVVHPSNDPHSSHYLEITISKNEPTFYVTCCCDDEWEWKFWYDKTNYEVVKYLIMDCIIACDTMRELIDTLDATFYDECAEIVCEEAELQEGEWECDGDCDNCGFNEDKYLN